MGEKFITMKTHRICVQKKSTNNTEVIKKPHDARLKHRKRTCCKADSANQQQHRPDNFLDRIRATTSTVQSENSSIYALKQQTVSIL